jgi:hypothetical protein
MLRVMRVELICHDYGDTINSRRIIFKGGQAVHVDIARVSVTLVVEEGPRPHIGHDGAEEEPAESQVLL